MKSLMIFVLILCIAGCLESPSIKIGQEGKKLPSFTFLLPDSTTKMYADSIREGKPFALFFYSPFCPFCRAQIRDLIENDQSLKDVRFYLMTHYDCQDVKRIVKEFKLENYNNIVPLVYQGSDLPKYFYIQKVPYLAIYDKQKRLKQVFIGRTDFNTIKKIISNID